MNQVQPDITANTNDAIVEGNGKEVMA